MKDKAKEKPQDILGYRREPLPHMYLHVEGEALTTYDIIRAVDLYMSSTGNKPITMLFPMMCSNMVRVLVDAGVIPRAEGLADGVSDLIIVGPGLRGAPLDFANVRTLLEADYQANKGV